MLIPSHRHRSADLELWHELEEADRIHGERLLLSGKVMRSMEAIREFAAAGTCYCSVSWGKDSVTLAYLIWLTGLSIPLFSVRTTPYDNPHTSDVRDAFLARFDVEYSETVVVSHTDAPFYRAFREAGSRHISGIRAAESGGRKIRMRTWGLASPNACAPLGWWTTADVFGYLAVHDLPTHPNYAMIGGGRWDRERIRVDELGGEGGSQFGRWDQEREYYGDILNRLAAKK